MEDKDRINPENLVNVVDKEIPDENVSKILTDELDVPIEVIVSEGKDSKIVLDSKISDKIEVSASANLSNLAFAGNKLEKLTMSDGTKCPRIVTQICKKPPNSLSIKSFIGEVLKKPIKLPSLKMDDSSLNGAHTIEHNAGDNAFSDSTQNKTTKEHSDLPAALVESFSSENQGFSINKVSVAYEREGTSTLLSDTNSKLQNKDSMDSTSETSTQLHSLTNFMTELKQSKNSHKSESVSTVVANSELRECQHKTQKQTKVKKTKRRHFKGGTYHLYLYKKKKKPKKLPGDTNSKDDEMSIASTENGSNVDWDDASSMFSEDMTVSEKSLVDEEACSNSTHSPIHSDVPMEISSENNTSFNESISKPFEVSTEKLNEGFEPLTCNDIEDVKAGGEKCSDTVLNAMEIQNNHSNMPSCSEPAQKFPEENGIEDKANINSFENVNAAEITIGRLAYRNNARKGGSRCKASIASLKGNCATEASGSPLHDENPGISGISTITKRVKSRTRIKRRFTDDIVDTDIGLLSLNSMALKKVQNDAVQHPKAAVEKISTPKPTTSDHQQSSSSTSKGCHSAKFESIFNPKQGPLSKCSCEDEGPTSEKKEGEFCQAVDVMDDKLLGCSYKVTTFYPKSPSVRIPFVLMCDMHLWRLKHHHCCPRCGLFCSQGPIVLCSNGNDDQNLHHISHKSCQFKYITEEVACLHCGNTSNLRNAVLKVNMSAPPTFHSNQMTSLVTAKARMCFQSSSKVTPTDDVPEEKFTLGENACVTISALLSEEEKAEVRSLFDSLNLSRNESRRLLSSDDLYTAASMGDARKVLHLIDQGCDPNRKYEDDNTPLHAASMAGNVIITHLLVESGAVTEALNKKLGTPMMCATENGHTNVVQYFIKRKTSAETRNESGMTCLHMAAREGNVDICQAVLTSARILLNTTDDGGWTPIAWASEHGHPDVVEYLLERGANPNVRDLEGNTALHWAAFSGNVRICSLLLDYCGIDEVNSRSDTPLHLASRQDNTQCVEFLIIRKGNLKLKNKAGEFPLDCSKENSATRRVINMNMGMKEIFGKHEHPKERIISNDIAKGRERYPIRCVNSVDDVGLEDLKFLYITQNCETSVIKMDRSITSLQNCNCTGDCTSLSCTCASISFKCWYDKEGHLLPDFDMIDPPMLFECNRSCSCNTNTCRNRVVQKGMTCRLELVRTSGKGWGVQALKDIPKGSFICEYVGEVISDSEADTRAADSYLFDLDNKDGETYCLDAYLYGNISRFINHLCEPNLVPVKVYVEYQDMRFPRIAFFSLRDIAQNEELGFDYGAKFWVIKYKYFTCNCGSINCKYSRDKIKSFLQHYGDHDDDDDSSD